MLQDKNITSPPYFLAEYYTNFCLKFAQARQNNDASGILLGLVALSACMPLDRATRRPIMQVGDCPTTNGQSSSVKRYVVVTEVPLVQYRICSDTVVSVTAKRTCCCVGHKTVCTTFSWVLTCLESWLRRDIASPMPMSQPNVIIIARQISRFECHRCNRP